MAEAEPRDRISLVDADRLGVAELMRAAGAGHDRVVLRDDRPVAAVIGAERLAELDQLRELEDDLLDLAMSLARIETTGPRLFSLDEIFARYGYSREQLRAIADEDNRANGMPPSDR